MPFLLQRLYRWEVLLSSFSARSEENARQAKELLFSVQNSRKARDGGLGGLLDPAILKHKTEDETKLKEQIARLPQGNETLNAWKQVAQAEKTRAANLKK